MVNNIPEIITIYFIQLTSFHNNQMPPKVNMIDRKGSIINNFLILMGYFVKHNRSPNAKNINENEST